MNKSLSQEQQIQEDQYRKPYHYFIRRNTYEGNFYFSYLDKCIEIVKSHQGKKVLDMGCGDGFFLSKLDNNKNELYGLDYSAKALKFAKLFNQDKNIIFAEARAEDLPYSDEHFDIISSVAVLEHIEPNKLKICIQEMHRVLKKGGILVIAVPSKEMIVPAKHFQHFDKDLLNALFLPMFKIENVFGCYNKRFRSFLKIFYNRYYDIRILSKYMMRKVFYKYFSQSPLKYAEMMVVVLKKI